MSRELCDNVTISIYYGCKLEPEIGILLYLFIYMDFPKSIRSLHYNLSIQLSKAGIEHLGGPSGVPLPIFRTLKLFSRQQYAVLWCHIPRASRHTMTERVEQRICIKFCQKLGHTYSYDSKSLRRRLHEWHADKGVV